MFENVISAIKDRNHDKWADQDKAREICIEAKDKQQTDTIARKKGILKNV